MHSANPFSSLDSCSGLLLVNDEGALEIYWGGGTLVIRHSLCVAHACRPLLEGAIPYACEGKCCHIPRKHSLVQVKALCMCFVIF